MIHLHKFTRIEFEAPEGSDAGGFVILKRPTNERLSQYQAQAYGFRSNRLPEKLLEAQCLLFDEVVTEIGGFCDDEGPITIENKERLWPEYKQIAVITVFDSGVAQIKNSEGISGDT